jgi:hypothetical protein
MTASTRAVLAAIPIRPAEPADRRLVVPTWVKEFAAAAPWSSRLARRSHGSVVDQILDGGARVVVLGHEGGAAHAWACGEDRLLHYVYVPFHMRGYGVARRLIAAVLGDYPSLVDCSHKWPWESRRFRWDPYPLMTCPKEAA